MKNNTKEVIVNKLYDTCNKYGCGHCERIFYVHVPKILEETMAPGVEADVMSRVRFCPNCGGADIIKTNSEGTSCGSMTKSGIVF